MDLMQVESLYELAEKQLDQLAKERLKMTKGKKGADFGTKQQQDQKLAPIEEGIKLLK